jgi:hypothetical protein
MASLFWLTKYAQLIAQELGIGDLAVGQHQGLRIDYFWLHWGVHEFLPLIGVVKSDQWLKIWMYSQVGMEEHYSVTLADDTDPVKALFDADPSFPNGEVFKWDVLDGFLFFLSDEQGTRTFDLEGEYFGDLARLRQALTVVLHTAELTYRLQMLQSSTGKVDD